MIAKSSSIVAVVLWVVVAQVALAESLQLKVTPQADGTDVPVSVRFAMPGGPADIDPQGIRVELTQVGQAGSVAGQIVVADGEAELWWILPSCKAGQTTTWTATLTPGRPKGKGFTLTEKPGDHLDICLDGKAVTRQMIAFDTSTPKRAHETYKVFNHVFDETGKELLTKGAGGKFTHHRGIFIGWNKVDAGGAKFDTWHMKKNNQVHRKYLERTAGPVLARTRSLIHWQEADGEPIVTEEREITVYRQGRPAILLLDFRSTITAVRGEVVLAGDPEHAGGQFRAHNDVSVAAGGKKQASKDTPADAATRYLFHAEGVNPTKQADLPWAAMSIALRGKRYNVQHMSHPSLPSPNKYSAYRAYGRFGAYCSTKIPAGKSAEFRYRYCVALGDLAGRAAPAARHAAFATPPKVEVVK